MDVNLIVQCPKDFQAGLEIREMDTWRMPLASISKVTSICGTPRGAGGMPVKSNLPNLKNNIINTRVLKQGCQMVYFQTENTNLGKFWRALEWKMLVYFMAPCNILQHLVYFMAIW
jgi:hypothetical protein